MIALIKGEIFDIEEDSFVILAGGVGYRVYTPLAAYETLPAVGDEIILHTHYHLRENDVSLFGFADKKELALFELLINVNGVGAKTALVMLNTLSYDQLLQSMQTGSISNLVKIPGIGKKTAERILLEMKDKLDKLVPAQVFQDDAAESAGAAGKNFDFNDKSTAVTALVQLGYNAAQATKYVDKAAESLEDTATIEQLITAALQVAAE